MFFALGAGQIHIAVIALVAYLFSENGYRLPLSVPRYQLYAILLLLVSVIFSIFVAPRVSSRMLSEALQAVLYCLVFLQFYSYIKSYEKLIFFLQVSTWCAFAIAIIAICSVYLGLTNPPHIFLARGGNEGSLFILIMGVLPASTLLLRDGSRVVYLLQMAVFIYAQYLATSRANVLLSFVLLGTTAYFLLGNRWLKLLAILTVSIFSFASLSLIRSSVFHQANASFFERIQMYEIAWDLWMERFWFGWGYGSTSELTARAGGLIGEYPHFHSTYMQILVEHGVFGALIIFLYAFLGLMFLKISLKENASGQSAFYLVLSYFVLFSSSFVEALHFGADRAVQVVIVFSIQLKIIRFIKKSNFSNLDRVIGEQKHV